MAKKSNGNKITIPNTTTLGGNVSLKIVSGKKVVKELKVHNMGTMNLFQGILELMRGDNYNSTTRLPKYLGISTELQPSTELVVTKTSLQNELGSLRPPLNPFRVPNKDVANGVVSGVFQGKIPYSYVGGATIWQLGAFGTATVGSNTLVAFVQLPSAVVLDKGQTLLVEWAFSAQNVKNIDMTTIKNVDTKNSDTNKK